MEVLTEVPQSGTRLRFESDRSFEQQPGDSVLRIHGQTPDGTATMDATYVEVDVREAKLAGWLIRSLRQPTPEVYEKVAQEIQAAFSARIGGRDAQQIAQLAWNSIRDYARDTLGHEGGPGTVDEHLEQLAERFERASAKRRQPAAFTPSDGGVEPSSRQQQ